MDITLIRTFLEVANTGSFVAASARLFVTQSAVSLRIQRLEDSLGHALFIRSKAGAVLTPEGHAFEPFALSLIKIWEEARQTIAIPEGYARSLIIGATQSLWPGLGFRWIDALQRAMPDLSIRAEVAGADRLTRQMTEGTAQVCLMYTPHLRPGLTVAPILSDELVLVASWPDATPDPGDAYVFVDWGPEFTHAHALAMPHLTNAGRTMALGSLTADYIVNRRAAAYLPARAVQRKIDSKALFMVKGAPSFPFPIWSVWRDDIDEQIAATAKATLRDIAKDLDAVIEPMIADLPDMLASPSTGSISILDE